MSAPISVINELQWRCQRCDQKRTSLLKKAHERERRYRILSFLLGLLSLLSPLTAAILLTPLVSSTLGRIATALFVFVSGVLGLAVTIFYNPKENKALFRGAAEFLVLRDRMWAELHKTSRTEAEALALAHRYGKRYAKVSNKYAHYLTSDTKKKDEEHERMMQAAQQPPLEASEIGDPS